MKLSFLDKPSNFPSDDYRSRNYSGKWQKRYVDEYVESIFAKGIDEAHKEFSDAKNEHLPISLYKFYRPSIHSLTNIQNKNVFLSSPRNFNDPFDSFICVDDQSYVKFFLLKALEQNNMISSACTPDCFSEEEFEVLKNAPIEGGYVRELGHSDDFKSRLFHICLNKSDRFGLKVNSISVRATRECSRKVDLIRNIPFRISCFSNFHDEAELGRNTTMWSHYAENHTGFCVKYSVNFDDVIHSDIIKCGLFPVMYTSRVPKLTLQDFKKLRSPRDDEEIPASILRKAYKAIITKSKFWNYEKEWRLIINGQNEVQLSYNTIPFLNIESIYLGCRTEPSIKKSLVQFAEADDIKIYDSRQSDEHFELAFRQVTTKTLTDDEFYSKLYRYNRIEDKAARQKNIRLLYDMFDE